MNIKSNKQIICKILMIGSLCVYQGLSVVFAANTGDAFFEDTYFTGSGHCRECHNGLTDMNGKDISIETDWSTSMMANAARDPYWQAKVASELHRNPGLASEINDKCSRCHAPMANESAHKGGSEIRIFGNETAPGLLDPDNNYFDMSMDGVSCVLCHQIKDDGNLGTINGISGKFSIEDYLTAGLPRTDRPLFGQYAFPRPGPMRNAVNFTPQHGEHMSTSDLCASCHDLKTAFVDAEGNIASTTPESEFPEQMVYSEWKHSAYTDGGRLEQSCQSCHMPRLAEDVKISTKPRNIGTRPDFSLHSMRGANTVMLDMLRRNRNTLGVSASDTAFDTAINETRQFLQQAAGISVNSYVVANGNLALNLRVTNNTGHKFPSGYPSRRAYIHLTAKDSNNDVIFESGYMNANGSILGVDSDNEPSTYEGHYQLIDSEDQVQVYGPVMGNTDGNVTHTLLRASGYLKDNRLLPIGFDKSSAPPDVAVQGAAVDDSDFIGGSDEITYVIDVTTTSGNPPENILISAELRYQPLAYGHLQDLFQDSAHVTQVNTFLNLFDDENTLRDELIGTASQLLPNSPGCAGMDIYLLDYDINTNFTCTATVSLAAGYFNINDGARVTLSAPVITLESGFSVKSGAIFTAHN